MSVFEENATFDTSDFGGQGTSGGAKYITEINYRLTADKPLRLWLLNDPDEKASGRDDDQVTWSFYRFFNVVPTQHYPSGIGPRDIPGEIRYVPLLPQTKRHVKSGMVELGYREPLASFIDPGKYPAQDGSVPIANLVLFNAFDADSGYVRVFAMSWPKWKDLCSSVETIKSIKGDDWSVRDNALMISIDEPGISGKLKVRPSSELGPLPDQPTPYPISELLTEKRRKTIDFLRLVDAGEIVVDDGEDDIASEWKELNAPPSQEVFNAPALQTGGRKSVKELRTILQEEGVVVPQGSSRADLERLVSDL